VADSNTSFDDDILSADDLGLIQVGDEIDSGVFIFEGLPDEEFIKLMATRVKGNRESPLVEFEVTYFGIVIGHWIAYVVDGGVSWMDQDKARKAQQKKTVKK